MNMFNYFLDSEMASTEKLNTFNNWD